ncbi:MAG: heavy-metal-associated domain-containing protein, partial [Bacteroidales bacterium]|nr:heavy-metal-associated domain-containing protein [Bacteroidales bacterium]
ITGMNCNHCKMSVENNLKKIEGIDNVIVNLEAKTATIIGLDYDMEEVKKIVSGLGFEINE